MSLRKIAESCVLPFYCLTKFPHPEARREADRLVGAAGITRHNVHGVDARIPLGVLAAVTGIFFWFRRNHSFIGAGAALRELVLLHLGTSLRRCAESATSEGAGSGRRRPAALAGDVDAIHGLCAGEQKPNRAHAGSNLSY